MRKKFDEYLKKFLEEETGMELLQMAIIVVVTVGLISAVFLLKNVVEKHILKAAEEADSQFQSIMPGTGNTGTGTGEGTGVTP